MDRQTGDVERISPGQGKTTCAWIHPTIDKVLFASTHADPNAAAKQQEERTLRSSGKERRYAWDYDPAYEIYEYDRRAKRYTPLTNAEGYDAEGSYAPDGNLIAYASNRRACMQEECSLHQSARREGLFLRERSGRSDQSPQRLWVYGVGGPAVAWYGCTTLSCSCTLLVPARLAQPCIHNQVLTLLSVLNLRRDTES